MNQQQPEYTYFTDRDLGHQLPEILRNAGLNVVRHDDLFAQDTQDTVWLKAIGTRGYVALTHDWHIRYVDAERDMVMRAGVPLLVLAGNKITTATLARNFMQTLPKVEKFLGEEPWPFIAKVYRPSPVSGVEQGVPGTVRLWLSYTDWFTPHL